MIHRVPSWVPTNLIMRKECRFRFSRSRRLQRVPHEIMNAIRGRIAKASEPVRHASGPFDTGAWMASCALQSASNLMCMQHVRDTLC